MPGPELGVLEPTVRCSRCDRERPAEAFPRRCREEQVSTCWDCFAHLAFLASEGDRKLEARLRHQTRLLEEIERSWTEPKLAAACRRYGVGPGMYARMLLRQNGGCGICRVAGWTLRSRSTDGNGLNIDHCHATGVVRGLLCRRCNTGIGQLGDNYESVARAAMYLHRNTPNTAALPRAFRLIESIEDEAA
jgi:hypothetical protein